MRYGFTIIIVPEIERGGCLYCGKCDTKLMLVIAPDVWDVDEEAFRSGEKSIEETPSDVPVGEITGHYCSKCGMLTSLSYNY